MVGAGNSSALCGPLGLLLAAMLLAACVGPRISAPVVDKGYGFRPEIKSQASGYKIRRGDTVYGIAQRHGISTRSLIDWNSLRPPYRLIRGEHLRLPQNRSYVVQRGDSVYAISRKSGVDMATLVRVNKMRPPYTIMAGQHLTLPINARPAPASRKAAVGAALLPQETSRSNTASQSTVIVPAAARPVAKPELLRPVITVAKPPPRAASGFIWPVEGRVLSSFGPKKSGLHNDGINIAAPQGAAVRAADNGVVAYSGKEIRGFGNLLLIKHEGGLITAYAHTDTLLVSRGDTVTRGQVIGKVGTTGAVETPQLHFEVRQGTRAVNPNKYLPS